MPAAGLIARRANISVGPAAVIARARPRSLAPLGMTELSARDDRTFRSG